MRLGLENLRSPFPGPLLVHDFSFDVPFITHFFRVPFQHSCGSALLRGRPADARDDDPLAIGATRPRIVWAAISDGVAVLASGVVVGIPLAVPAIRPLTDILPDGVNPWSVGMFAAVAVIPLAVGAGAAWLPAREVANVDPALALREE
jgi:hypothetical protein